MIRGRVLFLYALPVYLVLVLVNWIRARQKPLASTDARVVKPGVLVPLIWQLGGTLYLSRDHPAEGKQ